MTAAPAAVRLLAVLGAALLCTACGTTEPCTTEAVPGIRVELREAGTGLPAAAGATVVAHEGTFEETLLRLDDLAFEGLVERAGTYRIVATKPGYGTIDSTGVRIEQDRCHVRLVTLRLELQPE